MNWKVIKERLDRMTAREALRKMECGIRRLSGIDWFKAAIAMHYQENPFNANAFLISNSLFKTALQCQYLLDDFSKTNGAVRKRRTGEILLCSVFAGGYADRFKSLIDSRIDYCRRHGYSFALLKEAPVGFNRPYPWLRIPFIYRLLQDGYDRIFYLDADAIITNPEIKLQDFFFRMDQSPQTSLFLCVDGKGNINTGSFFLRRNAGAQQLLDLIWQNVIFINHYWWEQKAFIDVYKRFPEIRKIVFLTKHNRLFNSYDRCNDPWQKGDFILHLAGYHGDELLEKISFYQKYIN